MSPFKKPDKPRNSWELFKWTWFEFQLLFKYGETISKTEALILIFRNYILYVVPLALLLYVIGITIVIGSDLPIWMPTDYTEKLIIWWVPNASFAEKFELLFFYNYYNYLELMKQLAFGLVGGLAFGLAGGLAGGLVGGLVFGLSVGLAGGLAAAISYSIGYFRLPFYPFYFIKSLFTCQLKNNVYFQDDAISLPILGLKDKLTQQALKEPEIAKQFVDLFFALNIGEINDVVAE
jgi:hypothetical protein